MVKTVPGQRKAALSAHRVAVWNTVRNRFPVPVSIGAEPRGPSSAGWVRLRSCNEQSPGCSAVLARWPVPLAKTGAFGDKFERVRARSGRTRFRVCIPPGFDKERVCVFGQRVTRQPQHLPVSSIQRPLSGLDFPCHSEQSGSSLRCSRKPGSRGAEE